MGPEGGWSVYLALKIKFILEPLKILSKRECVFVCVIESKLCFIKITLTVMSEQIYEMYSVDGSDIE